MNRRFFLRTGVPASLMSSLLFTSALKGCTWGNMTAAGKQRDVHEGRVLVIIQLNGGNDGLNTVIPLDQYANLERARKNIMIADKKVLPLYNSAITGLHPALGELQSLYNNKQSTIIQGVGYATPDLSHFKAIDIWHTGSDDISSLPTGWLGRFLEQEEYKYDTQNHDRDLLAIQLDSSLSKALQGHHFNTGTAVRNTSSFYNLAIGKYGPAFDSSPEHPLCFLRTTIIESKKHIRQVKHAAQTQKNLSPKYPLPGNNMLADQLKVAAQLIGGGLQTKIYIASLNGFDTHNGQVNKGDTAKGDHADLLSQLSVAMAAFQDDLALMGKENDVLTMVFSEFGRRIISNAGYGCDHGTSAPVFLFGSKLKGGLIGKNPGIPAKASVNDNLPLQTNFRSVYSSILKDWFGASNSKLTNTLLGSVPTLDLFKS